MADYKKLLARMDEEIAVEAFYDTKQCGVLNDAKAAIESLLSERERKDEALRVIADDNSWRGFSPAPVVERMREFARAALSSKDQGGENG